MASSLTLAISAGLLTGGSFAAEVPSRPTSGDDAAVTQAVDIAAARAAARLSGKRVEALSERTETSTTWVNKDGSLTSEMSAGPTRFYDEGAGAWRAVDVNLTRAADGSVEAKAHPNGLRMSGGTASAATPLRAARLAKATDLVTLGGGDQQITLQWNGGLPAPKLDGTRAEYVNAVPGADVVVEATRTGFEQYVEINKRPGADGYSYTLPLRAKGLRAEQQRDGSVLFVDSRSGRRAVMPAPVMWDATVDPVSGEHSRKSEVGLQVVQKGSAIDLVVTPDAQFLADPDTKYPVTVDPSTSALSNAFDTYVQQGETRDWSTDTELDFGNPGTKNADGTARTAHSFISWNTTPLQNSLVLNAKLSLWNFHSANGADCKAQPWEVWSTGLASTSSRWTAQPAWTAQKATSTETRGNTACASAPDGWINADVTTLAQEWASAKTARGDMGIRASGESVVAQWKRVNSANAASNPPKLTVTYNYRPRTGTKQQAGPPYTQDKTGTWRVDMTTPSLRDTFTDPDGDKVNGSFQIFDATTNKQIGDVLVSPFVASGSPSEVKVPTGLLQHGHIYRFRTSPYDGTHYNLEWSPWATFSVSPLPSLPQDLQAGAEQTLTPILSAVVTDPGQGRVSGEFTLKDSAGSAVPGLTLKPVWTDSGRRAAVQIPDGALTDGATYYWSARACTTVGCSPWSAQQKLTVRVRPLTVPESKSLTLTDGKLTAASTVIDCDTACADAPEGKILAGQNGGQAWATWLKADLSALPKGAIVTGAELTLTRTDCTTGCTVQKMDLFQLAGAWSPGQSGQELLAAASIDSYLSGEALADADLAPVVQSWAELGDNNGMLLRAADGTPGASYYASSASDSAKRPTLTIQYIPPSVPGPVEDIAVSPGDKGLLVRWNPPLTGGAAGEDTAYTVKVENTDGQSVATVETTAPRAVVTGLDNSRAYRIAVTAHNSFGNGPDSRSALSQPAAVSGGSTLYQTYVQDYLTARGRILTGASLTAGDAAAESSQGAVFRDLLQAQEEGLVGAREALEQRGQSYSSASVELSDLLVRRGANTTEVIVRATVKESQTVRTDGVDDPTEGRNDKRFTFTVKDGAVSLTTEADDASASLTLSPTAAAEAQVEPEAPEDADLPADDDGALPLDDKGFPVADTARLATTRASAVDGHGTSNWAFNHRGIEWEYKQDCTNFVSKALYYGGHMKFRKGGRKADHSWWQEYYAWGLIKNKSYTWAGADNLRRHVTKYRHSRTVSSAGASKVGDLIFLKWKKESRYNHVAVVWANSRGQVHLVQHGIKDLTTLNDVIARYRHTRNPIEKILVVRVKDR